MNFSIKAPTVVVFLEGGNATVLRSVISTLLRAGRDIRVFAAEAPATLGAHVLTPLRLNGS